MWLLYLRESQNVAKSTSARESRRREGKTDDAGLRQDAYWSARVTWRACAWLFFFSFFLLSFLITAVTILILVIIIILNVIISCQPERDGRSVNVYYTCAVTRLCFPLPFLFFCFFFWIVPFILRFAFDRVFSTTKLVNPVSVVIHYYHYVDPCCFVLFVIFFLSAKRVFFFSFFFTWRSNNKIWTWEPDFLESRIFWEKKKEEKYMHKNNESLCFFIVLLLFFLILIRFLLAR